MVGATASGAPVKYRPSPISWLERRGVRLTPTGSDRYRCACPVHNGRPGSMGINRVDGVWLANCFSCGFAGDALTLVMGILSCSFKTALVELDCKPGDERAPVPMHRRPTAVVACDAPACGRTIEAEGRTYKIPGMAGLTWTTTPDVEALFRAELAGWWIGFDGTVAICEAHS